MQRCLFGLLSISLVVFFVPRLGEPLQAQERAITYSLPECIQVALKRSPEVMDANIAVEGAQAGRKSARGRLLPSVDVEGSVLVWQDEFKFSFIDTGGAAGALPLPNPSDPYQMALFGMLQGMGEPMTFREQITWGTNVTISQPLSPIYALFQNYKLKELGVDVARLERRMRRRDVSYAVAERFVGVLKANRALEIVESTQTELIKLMEQTAAFVKAEIIGRNELLKMKVALAQLAQQHSRVQSGLFLARRALALVMGLSDESKMALAAPQTEADRQRYGSLKDEIERALAGRPEMRQVDLQIQMAERGKKMASFSLVPNVALMGSWQHSEGSGMAEEDSLYVGVALQWNLWRWGADWYGISEADANLRRARLGRDRLKDYIVLDVTSAYQDLEVALQGIELASAVVESATENYRIEQKLYEAHSVSATDLLQAHSQLVKATSEKEIAYFDMILAMARLNNATGRTIQDGLGGMTEGNR